MVQLLVTSLVLGCNMAKHVIKSKSQMTHFEEISRAHPRLSSGNYIFCSEEGGRRGGRRKRLISVLDLFVKQ